MSTTQTLEVPGYQVVQYLGSGARSTIWQIRERRTEKTYALKRVVKRQASDQRFLEQALNEYEVSSHLDHPTVRKVVSLRKVKRWLSLREVHLVMEMCEGVTVQDSPPETVTEVARVFMEVAEALAHINARGFVHADIKPNNIMVAPDGSVKIIDLGQSCPLGTVKQRIQGTPDFIAPEQVYRRPLDARTDVYNFGAALYWTLVGKPIPTVLPRKHATQLASEMIITAPMDLDAAIPQSVSKLVMDCVETRPSDRPGTMNDVVARLDIITHTLSKTNGRLSRQQEGSLS